MTLKEYLRIFNELAAEVTYLRRFNYSKKDIDEAQAKLDAHYKLCPPTTDYAKEAREAIIELMQDGVRMFDW